MYEEPVPKPREQEESWLLSNGSTLAVQRTENVSFWQMTPVVAVLLLLIAFSSARPYCPGGSCNISTDCTQPSGNGGNQNGICCNNTGSGLCYSPGNGPPQAQGQTCDNTNQCLRCGVGLTCANAQGQQQGVGVTGPFTCQKILSQFTPGCACNTTSQCFGICGGPKSQCYATGLFSGSSCSFGQQCISGYCSGGSCQGFSPNVRTAICSDSAECPKDNRCSNWGVPPVMICHGLSGSGGMCYDDTDCNANRFQIEQQEACVGNGNNNAGTCVGLPGNGDACGTTTTPSICQLYTENGVEQRYMCNTSANPPRCVKPVSQYTLAIGQPCNYSVYPTCVLTAYCAMNSQQMPQNFGEPGVCTAVNNVPLGGNCSNYNACGGAVTNECRMNTTSGLWLCQTSSVGITCNHSDPSPDSTQCPSAFGNLVCMCNNTCDDNSAVVSGGSCGDQQTARWDGLLFGETTNDIDVSNPDPAWADFRIDQRALADRACCQQCGTASTTQSALAFGVVVDCASLTIKVPQICDASATAQAWLQNCASYKPNAGSLVTVSYFVVFLSTLLPLLGYVYN